MGVDESRGDAESAKVDDFIGLNIQAGADFRNFFILDEYVAGKWLGAAAVVDFSVLE